MTESRLQRVRKALLTARKLEPVERGPFLDEYCAGDEALRAEIESLLEHDTVQARIVQTGALAEGLGADMAPALEAIRRAGLPERIGPFRIVEVLGEGGMGVVYLARQEEPIRRTVALKLLKRGVSSPRAAARFEAETQALASMQHACIAKVFDAGTDGGGHPYLVMERVDGAPITEYCDDRRLSTRERVQLYLKVCAGVRHAHQKGVIHRDLKPSNILVAEEDGQPVPKIIDFGIAKTLDEGEGALSPDFTIEGQPMGTPAYMSPEQAVGDAVAVDTRSDVYSLGVILYELLTGRRPIRFETDSVREIQDMIRDQTPDRPSTAVSTRPTSESAASIGTEGEDSEHESLTVDRAAIAEAIGEARRATPAQLSRQLSGDLDNIVMMAMRKEPERRYGAVDLLAEDIERHLTGHPVMARGDSWSYRTGKFVTRHRVGVTIAAVLVLFLVGFAITVTVQSGRIAQERDRALAAEEEAHTEQQTAEEALDFVVGLFDMANPYKGGTEDIRVRDVLDTGTTRVVTELQDQPAMQARLLSQLGLTYHSLGEYERADSLLRIALKAHETAGSEEDMHLAQILDTLAILAHDQGRYPESEDFANRTIALRKKLLGEEHVEVAYAVNGLAVTLQAEGKLEEAEPHYREALRINRKQLGDEDPEVAWGLNTLGWLLHSTARYDEARRCYEEAEALQRSTLSDDHPDLAHTLNNLAGLYWELGRHEPAERIWAEALSIYRAVFGDEHAAVGRGLRNYSRVFLERGDLDEAERLLDEALVINLDQVGHDHPHTAVVLNVLGIIDMERGALDRAEARFLEAKEILEATMTPGHPRFAPSETNLGRLALARGDNERAREHFERALGIHRDTRPDNHYLIGESLVMLGTSVSRGGDAEAGEAMIEEGLAVLEQTLPSDHWRLAHARSLWGECALARGEREAGLTALTESASELRASLGPEAPLTRRAVARMEAAGP